MIHTFAQVLGLVLALSGAWVLGGIGAVMLLAGLVVALASLAIEVGGRAPTSTVESGE